MDSWRARSPSVTLNVLVPIICWRGNRVEGKVWGTRKVMLWTPHSTSFSMVLWELQGVLLIWTLSCLLTSSHHLYSTGRPEGALVFCECWEIDAISFLFHYFFCKCLVGQWIRFVIQVQALQMSWLTNIATVLLPHCVTMFPCLTLQGHPGIPGYPGLDGVEGMKVISHMKVLKHCFFKNICMNKYHCPNQISSLPLYHCNFQYVSVPHLLYC